MTPTIFARTDGSIPEKPSSKIRKSEEKKQDRTNEIISRQAAKVSRFQRKHRNLLEKANLGILIVVLLILVGAITVPFFVNLTYPQAAQDKISSEIFHSSYTQLEKYDEKVVEFPGGGMRELREQMSTQIFDSKFQTFFNKFDKDADGSITEEEVRESITPGTWANKLSNIQKPAEKYARLIMEELNPEEHGYIMIIALGALTNKVSNIRKQAEKYARLIMEELDPEEHGYNMSVRVWESKNLRKLPSWKLKPTSAGNPNLSQMLRQKLKQTSDDSTLKKGFRATKEPLSTKWQSLCADTVYRSHGWPICLQLCAICSC